MSKIIDVTGQIVPSTEDADNEPEVNLDTDDENDNATDTSAISGSQSGDDASDDGDSEYENEEDDELQQVDDDEGEGELDGDGEGGKNKGDDEDEIPKISKKTKSLKRKTGSSSKKNTEDDLTLLGVPHGLNFDDDEDDDESDDEHEDEEYFQKLKMDVRQNFAEIYHPESFSNNYDEIQTLSKVIRNSAGVIIDDLHQN
jgi:hypothetical protein